MAPRLLAETGVARRVAPFAAAAAVAALTLVIPGHHTQVDVPIEVLGVALMAAAIVVVVALPWRRWPPWLEISPVMLFLVSIALLRHSQGGAISGFGPLVVLPIVFVALYGSRADAIITLVGSTLVFAVPAALLDEVRYPDTEWRRTILWSVVGVTISTTIRRLVREIRGRAAALEALGRASRALTAATDPRSEVCRAVCIATEGQFAILLAAVDDFFVPISSSGVALPDYIKIARDDPGSGTATAFARGTRVFAPDAGTSLVSERFVNATGIASAAFEPVLSGGRPIAVLLVGFTTRRSDLADHVGEALSVLAADAALAIERDDLLATLHQQATHDPLTGAANRRMFDEFLERELARARRGGDPLSIALLDLDHFKAFNDANGHTAGDELLRVAARAWTDQLRSVDLLARYGGEEFVAVLIGADLNLAHSVAERLRVATPSPATCSIGVATWDGTETPVELVARSDAALYRAKSAGRDQVVLETQSGRATLASGGAVPRLSHRKGH